MTRSLSTWPALLLLLAACSGSSGDDGTSVAAAGPPSAQTATVTMTDKLHFDPAVVTAAVGTLTLTASNTGAVPHDLTFNDTTLGHTPEVAGGKTADLKLVFSRAGTFSFVCTLHARMSGKVVVSSPTS